MIRFLWMAAAIAMLALGSAAQAGHHETRGKGHEKAAEKARGKMKDAKDRAEPAREEGEQRAEEAAEDAGKGRGAEMRARRDERKEIMDEYKEGAEPGTPREGKKPWWRFWESDEEWESDPIGGSNGDE